MLDYVLKKTTLVTSGLSSTISKITIPVTTLGSFIWDPVYYIWPTSSKSLRRWSTTRSSSTGGISAKGSYGKPGDLYAFVLDEKRNVFKVGKSINVTQRIRSYKTTHPDGYVLHKVSCHDMDHAEHILHNILKLNGHHVKQEIFTLPPAMLKEYMDLVASLCRGLRQTKSPVKVARMTRFINQITN